MRSLPDMLLSSVRKIQPGRFTTPKSTFMLPTWKRRPLFTDGRKVYNERNLYFDPDIASNTIGTVHADDEDGDTVTYALINPPSGFTIDNSGVISYSGQKSDLPKTTPLTVRASDGQLSSDLALDLIKNAAPVFTTKPASVYYVNPGHKQIEKIAFSIHATDADGQTLEYSLSESPRGYQIDKLTGLLNYRGPADDAAGSVVVSVSDGIETTEYQFTVINNHPPTFSTDTYRFNINQTANPGIALTTVAVSDADGDSITYALENSPSGFSIDSTSGAVFYSGDIDSLPKKTTLIVQASDGKQTTQKTISLLKNHPPVFLSSTPSLVYVDDTELKDFSVITQVQATDLDGDEITYSLNDDGIPTYYIDAKTGVIQCTPEGVWEQGIIKVKASDGSATVEHDVRVEFDRRPEFQAGVPHLADIDPQALSPNNCNCFIPGF